MLSPITVRAEATAPRYHAGDIWEITVTRDSTRTGSDGSSGSSHDRDVLIQTIESTDQEGAVMRFDLPGTMKPEERQGAWQWPARVLKRPDGSLNLLNQNDLESRLDQWLGRAQLPRAACGKWIFTWNAFKIECDPLSVLEIVRTFDPQLPTLQDGAVYHDPSAAAPSRLASRTGPGGGSPFSAHMDIDEKAVARSRAEGDVVAGEVTGKAVTLEAALATRAQEQISGTIDVAIGTDEASRVREIKTTTALTVREVDGTVTTQEETELLERKPLSHGTD